MMNAADDPDDVDPVEPDRAGPLEGALLLEPAAQLAFVLAGDAVFTVRNVATGGRFTFRVKRPRRDLRGGREVHFASVLAGPDNVDDYAFLGTIFERAVYRRSVKSAVGALAPSARAFAWLWERLAAGRPLPPSVELWHAGRCGRCSRPLTDPESIASGLGPVCRGRGA